MSLDNISPELSAEIKKFDDLIEEHRLQIQERLELSTNEVINQKKIMEEARKEGDLRENAAFHAAKEALVKAEYSLRSLTRTREILNTDSFMNYRPDGFVGQGTTLFLSKMEGSSVVYTKSIRLVQKEISDAENGLISLLSPVGKALEGRESGDTIQVRSNSKVLSYKIEEVY